MSADKEIISFILSGDQMRENGQIANHFVTLSEISIRENLDAEFIIVVSYSDSDLQESIKSHSMNHPVQIVVVGERNSWDQEVFAGLTRANGDYSLVVGKSLEGLNLVFPIMLNVAKSKGTDVVGLRRSVSVLDRLKGVKTEILFSLLRNRTQAPLSLSNCNELLITRKALNWIIRDLSTAQSMIEMFLIPGLTFGFVPSELTTPRYKLSRSMYSRLLTRYTHVPQTILRISFSLTTLVMLGTSLNALSVRWRGVNLFNHVEMQIPGWTTLVLLMSFGFSITIYSLYVLLRTILHLADQYSSKPNHIIKSVQRP